MKMFLPQNLRAYWKQLTTSSINKKIFAAALTVGLGTGLVKIAAVGKELVVAWSFGTGDAVDAFLIALIVPFFIINVVASSFDAALIPTYIRVRETDGTASAQKLFSNVTIWSLGLLGSTTILMVVTAPLYLPLIASGFSTQKLELTYKLLYALAPVVLLNSITTIWSAVLNAIERFALAAIVPILTPAITILLLLIFHDWGIFALAGGLAGGAFLELILLGFALNRQGISLLPKWHGFDNHLRQVTSQYVPMIAGSCLINTTGLIDQSMAAMLSPGSVAALNYGNRIIAFVLGLTTTALSTAVIPYFSKMVANSNWQDINHTLKRYLYLIIICTVPLTICLYFFSEHITQIIFQRGEFGFQDTIVVSDIQKFYALQIPFYIANILVVRMISALQANQILMWVSAVNLSANIVFNLVLSKFLGISGIALSTSGMYIVCLCMTYFSLLYLLKKRQLLN